MSNRVHPKPGRMRPAAKAVMVGGFTLALLGGGLTSASAAIPAPNGVISACYAKSDGAVRIIDASKTGCKSYRDLLTWNQVGPMGPQGPQGIQGVKGNTSRDTGVDWNVSDSRGRCAQDGRAP